MTTTNNNNSHRHFNKLILNNFSNHFPSPLTELDETSLDYISHLLRDTDVPDDEKLETIRGILELQLTDEPAHNHDHHHTPSHEASGSGGPLRLTIDECIEQLIQLASNPPAPEAEEEETLPSPPCSKDLLNRPDPTKDSDQLRKKALITAYGKVEDESSNVKSSEMTARQIQQAQELQTSMLDQQLKLLSLKSKTRKKAEAKMGGDPLLRPNLNAAVVDYEAKLRREEAASKAKAKSDKDKADLNKQRESQAKKKADARARASKGERKA